MTARERPAPPHEVVVDGVRARVSVVPSLEREVLHPAAVFGAAAGDARRITLLVLESP